MRGEIAQKDEWEGFVYVHVDKREMIEMKERRRTK